MGKKIISMLLLFSMLKCEAQVSLTLQLPPNGVLLKNQLWNIGLVYTGNVPLRVRIGLTLTDLITNQPVITATSGAITLSGGAKQLQAADAGPIQYQYPLPSVIDHNPDGFLSAGNYQACYTVMKEDKVNPGPLAEDCVTFEVVPLSPPVLNMPFNEDTIQIKYPQFTWLPPTPVNIFSNLSYKFNLVVVAPGQSPVDALQQNIPVYVDNDCIDVYLNYPSSGTALDTGKQYAWQITAQNNLIAAAQSEVWTFRVADSSLVKKPFVNSYVLLRNNFSNAVYTVEGQIINIKYYSFDNVHDAEMKFISVDGHVIKTIKQKIVYGNNYFNLPLNSSFKKGQVYSVEIKDLNNSKYAASFIIK